MGYFSCGQIDDRGAVVCSIMYLFEMAHGYCKQVYHCNKKISSGHFKIQIGALIGAWSLALKWRR